MFPFSLFARSFHEAAKTNNPLFDFLRFHQRLQAIFKQLDVLCPRFPMHHSQITVLSEPAVFYATLKEKILAAKSRVFLLSLYVGKAQKELIATLDEALSKNDNLHVQILTDALRGTREAPNTCSASLLVELNKKFGSRCDIRMYHTPHLNGWSRSLAPKRFNETWGLQHMKLYGFDDEIMLSGANLSQDYFTDRQDRYYVFQSKEMTDYYHRIHNAVLSFSFQVLPSKKLQAGFKLSWPTSNQACDPQLNVGQFVRDTTRILEPIIKQHELEKFEEYGDVDEYDTIVYAILQFTPLFGAKNDQLTEKPAILRLLTYLDSPSITWWFTAGYFNMIPEIQAKLINGHAKGTVMTASAKANSFYKSPGVSYYLPQAYLLVAKNFLLDVFAKGKQDIIKLFEWQKGEVNTPGGWLYHAKGIWITVPGEQEPSITVIGSSNYTKRAYSLDLESNAIIITKSPELKSTMKHEIDNLMTHARELTLQDFEPKVVGYEKDQDGNDVVDKPILEVHEDRKISYGVHLGLKVLGNKL